MCFVGCLWVVGAACVVCEFKVGSGSSIWVVGLHGGCVMEAHGWCGCCMVVCVGGACGMWVHGGCGCCMVDVVVALGVWAVLWG